jgi:hypothetical protein
VFNKKIRRWRHRREHAPKQSYAKALRFIPGDRMIFKTRASLAGFGSQGAVAVRLTDNGTRRKGAWRVAVRDPHRKSTAQENDLFRKQKRHPKVAFHLFLVARGGIEPPTQGFSILCSTD